MSLLELEKVVKRYQAGEEQTRAVDNVDLHADAGEMLAVHGPSGSGKTTLLLLIAGLLAPDAGTIRYRGRVLSTLSEREASDRLMLEVGFIYQSTHLLARVSALENAAVKLMLAGVGMRAAQARARPYLERLGLGEHLERTPEQLSGGERQRVAIARALAGEPKLILADEPTGNLDSSRSSEVIGLLGQVAREADTCVVLVTHDTDAAAIAQRRYTLRDGRLEGEADEGTGRGSVTRLHQRSSHG
ncbi:MAG: ABC transporter ATP-binding protein [Solirubrobacteraceae bacterium]